MNHKIGWTSSKIARQLTLIESVVYRRHHPLTAFRHTTLTGPKVEPPTGKAVDDSDWETIEPNTYWGRWMNDFVLRTSRSIGQPLCVGVQIQRRLLNSKFTKISAGAVT